MDMVEVLKSNFIKLGLESTNKEDSIRELIEIGVEEGMVNSKEILFKDVMERESAFTTKIMEKIAIPHAKSNEVNEPFVVFGRSDKGITWNENDEDKVFLEFLILVPNKNASNEHMKILTTLARCLSHKDFRENLLRAENKQEVIEIVNNQVKKICENN